MSPDDPRSKLPAKLSQVPAVATREPSRPAGAPRGAEEIRQDIERAREQLAANAHALKEEMAAKVDWRAYVRERPYVFVAGAFAVGLYLGISSRRRR